MIAKKLFLGVVVVMGLLVLWGTVSAIAQTDVPATVLIPGKPLPGSYTLPERLPGQPELVQDAQPEQIEGMQNWHRLVFQSYRDNNWEIYGADGFGQGQTNFTNSAYSSDSSPRLSPDATKITFQANWANNYDIYWMNWGGSAWVGIVSGPGDDYSPVWSPNGQKLAFVSNRDGNTEIYTVNLDGSAQVRLTNSTMGDASPNWSPDGSQIIWVRYQEYYGALWVMNADGSNAHAITENWAYMGHPSWSPDGRTIGFDCDADGDGWNELVLIDADGSDWRILHNPGSGQTDDWMGSWSSNSQMIVFSYVNYVIYGGQLYLSSTYIKAINPAYGYASDLVTSGYDLLPNWVSQDTLPPISQVKNLPEYSRASGFWVNWMGVDRGVSGLYQFGPFEVEYRLGTTGEWRSMFGQNGTRSNGTSFEFSTDTIDTAYFHSGAWDDAENWEGWPTGNGDAWTKLYVWLMKGAVKDVRGYPIPNATMTFSPLPWEQAVKSDPLGRYGIHLNQEGNHTTTASHNGYGTPDSLTNAILSDSVQDVFLPTQDDLIQHGNFETANSLSSWMSGGTLPVLLTTGYSGNQGAVLGKDCGNSPCLTAPEIIGDGNVYSYPTMDVDPLGNVHVIWNQGLYSMRSLDGTWSTPISIISTNSKPALVVDNQGTIHVVFFGGDGLYYLQKTSGGTWTTPQFFITSYADFDIALDNDRTLYVNYSASLGPASSGLYLIKRTTGGEWGQPVLIYEDFGSSSDVTVGPDHLVHIAYRTFDYDTYYATVSSNGTLISSERLIDADRANQNFEGVPEIVSGLDGMVHVMSEVDRIPIYMRRSPQGDWSRKISLPDQLYFVHMETDSFGGVHLIGAENEHQVNYYYKALEQSEFSKYPLPSGNYIILDASIDIGLDNRLHLVWPEDDAILPGKLAYRATAIATQPEDVSISQVVNITSINQPTLSFMHTLSHDASSFDVSISDTPTSTVVVTPTTSADWAHNWIDMSPWAGKTVTVTFALHQAANEPYAHLFLDDISLGAWLTPVIHQVSPTQVDAGVAATLVITGENFIATPTVRLNGITLANVQFVDSNTLQVLLPGNLPPGKYTLWVINPQGQEYALPGAVIIGHQIYLPLLKNE